MVDQEKLDKLWAQVNVLIKEGPINRSLWDAVAAAKPLAVEDNVLILGLAPRNMRHGSYLDTMVNKTRIQEIVQARTGLRLDIRVIEGDTVDAWERVKERDRQSVQQAQAASITAQAHHTSVEAWEDLNQRLVRLFSQGTLRRYPIALARLLIQGLQMTLETDTQVRVSDPGGEEIHDRELNRVCDKLATYCEMPATSVAIEYLRLRSRRQQQQQQQG
jgi:hypothetical protein